MNVSVLVNAFTGGELSPLLAARMDTPNYTTGAKRIENAIPMVTGGIRKRPGTWYLRNTTGNKPVILIDWLLTDGTSCLVEISEQANGLQARVTSEGLTEGVAVFPAQWTNVDLAKVRHAIGRGAIENTPVYFPRFVALAYDSCIYSDDGGSTWTQGTLPVSGGWASLASGNGRFVALENSSNVGIYSDDGGETWTQVTLPVSGQWEALAYGNGRFVALGYGTGICIYSDDGGATWTSVPLSNSYYWTAITYANGHFVAISSQPQRVTYSEDGGETWKVVAVYPQGELDSQFQLRALAYGNGRFVVTAIQRVSVSLFVNVAAYSEDNGRTWTAVTNIPIEEVGDGPFDLLAFWDIRFLAVSSNYNNTLAVYSDDGGNTWSLFTNPPPVDDLLVAGQGRFVMLGSQTASYSEDGGETWTQVTLPVSGQWEALAYGSVVQPGANIVTPDYILFTSEDHANMGVLQIRIQNNVIAVDVNPFIPIVTQQQAAPTNVKDIAFYAGRLALGGLMASGGSPTRIMLSRAPDSLSGKYRYNDFTAKAGAGDAIIIDENDMAGSAIEWVFGGRRFLAATGRASWMDTGDVPTPATFDMGIVEYAGAAFHKAVGSKEIVVYVGRDGKRLRAMVWQYSNNSGGYADVDIGVVAQHLFSSGIVSYAAMDYPFPTIWIVNGAGELISCTINMQAGISAFARHSLGNLNPTPENPFYAYAESVEVARRKEGDRVYVVVRRGNVTTGVEARSIEWLELEDLVTADYTESHYVDSGVRVEFSTPSSTISGLERLAGQTVSVFADGALEATKEVSAEGTLTLDAPVKKAHVGLPITTRLSLNTAQIPANGSSFGKKRRIEKIILNLYKSIGGTVGTTEKNGEVVITQRFDQYAFGQPVEPFTGNIELFVSGNIDTDGALFITHTQPTPFTALGVVERIAIMEG